MEREWYRRERMEEKCGEKVERKKVREGVRERVGIGKGKVGRDSSKKPQSWTLINFDTNRHPCCGRSTGEVLLINLRIRYV